MLDPVDNFEAENLKLVNNLGFLDWLELEIQKEG